MKFKNSKKIYEQHANQLNDDEWTQQFQEVERTLNDKGKGKDEEYLNWKEEFEKNAYASVDQLEGDENQDFDDAWEDAQANTWEKEFEEYENNEDLLTDPDPITGPLEPYTFEVINPYLDNPNAYEEGLKLLETGGSLSTAALAFEAVVQKDPKNGEAWLRLGNIQAENEKERPAIAALQRAVRENPENLEALMSLSISYTNEAMNLEAYSTLERWIKVQYPQVVKDNARTRISLEHIISLFLEAARLGPKEAAHKTPESEALAFDPDVQSGLGVLFFNDFDYDKAVDCFKAALSVRPNDYLLWNRLGATLANSGRCEEASNAYYQALELKPTFVRCRYNLGIACMNIGCYKEAVEHFLGALSMHIIHYSKDGKGNDAGVNISDSIWESLRRTFVLMERHDLAKLAKPNTDLSVFEKEFEF
ncbi:TPR-like protein [Neocallimastix californiae]|uniref:TPR-like protein n=1 Tax=Neocallimastix californiae TaxID=1754190 RepID=A0A1Y2DCN1_9FUNG|nr:TPR-like protein [Neocallimastix californiae]|eukprot:ORY57033.1 TPR-like protein [Neocallimastix californiae]